MKKESLPKKNTSALFDQFIISPTSEEKLINNGNAYQTEKKNEEYPIIQGVPVLIDKDNFNDYLENKYKIDFKYFRSWDFAFIKNLKKKLQLEQSSLLLDIGGGEGFYSKCFSDLGIKTVTLDFSKYMLEKGKKNHSSLSFIAADANKIPFKNNTFDVIFCSGLSSFNTDELSKCTTLIDHMISKLKVGGVLIFVHSTNLTGKFSKEWYNITYNDLNNLFQNNRIIYKWFIPRPLVSNILNQLGFTTISSKFFGFIIRATSFINEKIRGRIIFVIKKE